MIYISFHQCFWNAPSMPPPLPHWPFTLISADLHSQSASRLHIVIFPPSYIHPPTLTLSSSHPHTVSLPPSHCHPPTLTLSSLTLILPPSHCHPSLILPPSHSQPPTLTLSSSHPYRHHVMHSQLLPLTSLWSATVKWVGPQCPRKQTLRWPPLSCLV